MRKITFLLFVFCALFSASQNVSGDQSIYKTDLTTDGALIAVSSLGIIIPYAAATHIVTRRCPCDPNELGWLDRTNVGNNNGAAQVLSNVFVTAAVAAPAIVDYLDLGFGKELTEDMIVYTETLTIQGALVTAAKFSIQRPLPTMYAGQSPDLQDSPNGYLSFYSGHTSTTVSALTAAAMTRTLRHGHSAMPWIITGFGGAAVGYSLIAGGQHFYSDVIVGAMMGFSVGALIPYFHRKFDRNDSRVGAIPVLGGAALTWTKTI